MNDDDTRVREHLANERTYLAWLRTGISLMGFGVVIAKLRYLFPGADIQASTGILHAAEIGLVFSGIGVLVVIVSVWRFTVVQAQLRQQSYRSSKGLVLTLSAIVIVLGATIVAYLAGV